MAGELGWRTVLSCTSRSKIWDPAGEESRGEVDSALLGEEGEGKQSCCELGAGLPDPTAPERFDESLVMDGTWVAPGEVDDFFLPNPNRARFLPLPDFSSSACFMSALEAASAGARGVEVPRLLSSAMSSCASLSPPVIGAASARLMLNGGYMSLRCYCGLDFAKRRFFRSGMTSREKQDVGITRSGVCDEVEPCRQIARMTERAQ